MSHEPSQPNAFAAEVTSISRLAAGPDSILFVADWKTAGLRAIKRAPAPHQSAAAAFNILDLETLRSSPVGGAKVTVEDMVACPGTGEVHAAVRYGAEKAPALFAITATRRRVASTSRPRPRRR